MTAKGHRKLKRLPFQEKTDCYRLVKHSKTFKKLLKAIKNLSNCLKIVCKLFTSAEIAAENE